MYQVNIIYNKEIIEIIFNCLTIEDASKTRYNKINKWFNKKMNEGIEPAEINELLEIEIKEQN